MKATIKAENWIVFHPVCTTAGGWEIEIPDSLVERWKACWEEFEALQDEFGKLHDGGLYRPVKSPDTTGAGDIV